MTKQIECEVENCSAEAEYDSPANLCEKHWQMWFNGNIEDADECLKQVLAGEEVDETAT